MTDNADPTSQPLASLAADFMRAGNPPVIIDGGSLVVASPATLKRFDDDENSPKKYNNKYKERNRAIRSLGVVQGIRIVDDYGLILLERRLQNAETLKVHLWIQRVTSEQGDEDDDQDVTEYAPIADPNVPDIVIQGGALEIRLDKEISKDRKVFRRREWNPKRRHLNDWSGGHSPFRLAQVKVFVNNVEVPPSPLVNAETGFRIILAFGT